MNNITNPITIRFYGGPLDKQTRVLENLVSEYKVPIRIKKPFKLLEGSVIVNVYLTQRVIYHRSGRGVDNIYSFYYEEPDNIQVELDLATTKPIDVKGFIARV